MIALLPEPKECHCETKGPFRIARHEQTTDRRAEVVVLEVAVAQPGFAVRGSHLQRFFLGEHQHVGGVGALGQCCFGVLEQLLAAVLPKGLEQDEPRRAVV